MKMKRIAFFALITLGLIMMGCTSTLQETNDIQTPQEKIEVRAVYLVPENGGILDTQELLESPEVAVVHSFEALAKSVDTPVAIWIDKDAVDMMDKAWLQEPPQNKLPVVLVGYWDALYAFRDILGGMGTIEGPKVERSEEIPEPGFSIWMIKEKTEDSTSSFMKGYAMQPSAKEILSITNDLLGIE